MLSLEKLPNCIPVHRYLTFYSKLLLSYSVIDDKLLLKIYQKVCLHSDKTERTGKLMTGLQFSVKMRSLAEKFPIKKVGERRHDKKKSHWHHGKCRQQNTTPILKVVQSEMKLSSRLSFSCNLLSSKTF